MSDMQRPMGGMPRNPRPGGVQPPSAGGPSPSPQVDPTDSAFNATDVAKNARIGRITPDMTIREYFQVNGMDVDRNTVADLAQWAQKQAQQRTTLGKIQSAGASPLPSGGPPPRMPAGQGAPSPMGGGPTPPAGGMEGIMRKLGGR